MRNFTKIISPLFFLSIIGSLTFVTYQNFDGKEKKNPYSSKDHDEKENPENPGWMSQLFEMKKNQFGEIDWKLINKLTAQTLAKRKSFKSSTLLSNIQEKGPDNVGGRTRAFIVDAANPNRLFAGGISGGLWVSTNSGGIWTPVDDNVANTSITWIVQSPFDHDVMYYTTGEAAGNSAGIPGNGIYKSTDGGTTFNLLPNSLIPQFTSTWKIVHSLVDSNTIFVASAWGGVFRSTNGGNTFHNVFGGGNITDIETFPDSSIVIARHGSGLFYSPNGDSASFTEFGNTVLPTSSVGIRRIQFEYAKSNPLIMYAMYENSTSDDIHSMWRSSDGGVTWTEKANPGNFMYMPFPWYCMMFKVSDFNPNIVITGGVECGLSYDGGTTWLEGFNSHADYHVCVNNPTDPNEFYIGNDGGVHKYSLLSFGLFANNLNNSYNVTQFYAGYPFPTGSRWLGGTQDNGTQRGLTSLTTDHVFGGDGAFCFVNPQNQNVSLVSWQDGHIQRSENSLDAFPDYNLSLYEMDSDANGDVDDNVWFINPFEGNELDGDQIFFPTRDRLWRSITGGYAWEPATSPITNLYAVGISNSLDPVVYVAGASKFFRLNSGLLSTPGMQVNLSSTIPSVVLGSFISSIAVSGRDPGTCFVSFSGIEANPRVYKLTNATTTPVWTSIHGDLPTGLGVNWIEVSPYLDDYLFAGTDFGMYTSTNGGVNWELVDEIPNVPVHQVRIRKSDMKIFIFTHGRGTWVADIPNTGFSVENESMNTTKIFPTITTDIVQIETEVTDFEIHVYDMNGKLMSQTKNVNSISLLHLPSSMYLVSVYSNGKKLKTQRVFKS